MKLMPSCRTSLDVQLQYIKNSIKTNKRWQYEVISEKQTVLNPKNWKLNMESLRIFSSEFYF